MRGTLKTACTVAGTACIVVAAVAIALGSMKYHERLVAARSAAAGQLAGGTGAASASPPAAVPGMVRASLPSTGFRYLGVYEDSSTSARGFAPVEEFAHAVGRRPNIVMTYSTWREPFSLALARTARRHGASLLIDLDPTGSSCATIASGHEDAYLNSYAQAVKAFGGPVIISFGHEMNGTWYPWGWTHTSPAAFVRAWRHIVDVFRQDGADNVTWLWTVNSVASYEGPIRDYWPGAGYVTWVGVDAYYYNPGDDFGGVFGTSIAQLRGLTNKPLLIGETAIGPVGDTAAKIQGLFAGISSAHLLGFVWYDQGQSGGLYHQAWRLEGRNADVAAFRAAAANYLPPSTSPASPRRTPAALPHRAPAALHRLVGG